ncbi:protein of unknown function [Mesorhizobium albiziae]|uniref:DUF1127 domain-containing protein n=1 Tax=Neomesorhizobium albiziae TaxID=335020 RepID=A0A1I3Z9T2_9HYPH|nr:DUF1127 domain-containing protein [Mesorhizobium albiziae]GLS32096.1 hypothetical protein GCM10007937_38060 [Mesorhizobium albiziae]SFK40772.1 protein of unknown function [Mesorhizobium albiziae]
MPRHPTKREIPQKAFLPPRVAGRVPIDSGIPVAMPATEVSWENSWIRYAPSTAARFDASFRRQPPAAPPQVAGGYFVAGFFSRIIGFAATELSRRAERRALWRASDSLNRAPDHLLRDIGISRSEIAYRLHFAEKRRVNPRSGAAGW